VTESSGNRPEPSLAAMHQLHSQPGLFAIHTELLTVTVIQPGGSCNMTTSLLADDPNAYMLKMCSRGYYGPLCSLCLLHNALPGEDRHGRTGNLDCQKCRCVSALSCNLLHWLASCCLCWAGFPVALLLPSVSSVWFCRAANMSDSVLCCAAYVHVLLTWLLMLAISNNQ